MTKPANRVSRKNARRERAVSRLQKSLSLDVRHQESGKVVSYDAKSRAAALEVVKQTEDAIYRDAPKEGVRTKKDRSGRAKFKKVA